MAIQLFNATATSLNCISQRCRFGQGRWQHPAAQRARKGQLSEPRHYQSSAGAGTTRYLTAQADQQKQSLAQTNAVLSKKEQELCCCSEKVHFYQERSYPCTGCCQSGQKDPAWQLFADRRRILQAEKQADHGYMVDVENRQLKQQLSAAQQNSINWQTRYRNLQNKVQPYLDAMRHAPERVRNFLRIFWRRSRNGRQMHRPKPAPRRTPNFNVIWM